ARQKRGIEILKQEAGTQLDAKVVHAFLRYYSGKKGFGWWGAAATMPQHALETIFAWFRNATFAGAVQTAAAAAGSVALVAGSGGLTIDASSATRPAPSTVQAVSPPTQSPTQFPFAEQTPVAAESTNSHGVSNTTGDAETATPSEEPAEAPSPGPTQSDPDEPTDELQQVIEDLLKSLPIPGP
ncbi:MAG: hypothetical protein KY429_12155, partial [Actinobacteria bacterium]|nr:hypothetical protein [Actinomycetota bacterium]